MKRQEKKKNRTGKTETGKTGTGVTVECLLLLDLYPVSPYPHPLLLLSSILPTYIISAPYALLSPPSVIQSQFFPVYITLQSMYITAAASRSQYLPLFILTCVCLVTSTLPVPCLCACVYRSSVGVACLHNAYTPWQFSCHTPCHLLILEEWEGEWCPGLGEKMEGGNQSSSPVTFVASTA